MSESQWVPDLRSADFLHERARAEIALAVLPQAVALAAAGRITKPEKGNASWRAACFAFAVADSFLSKWKSDAEPDANAVASAMDDLSPVQAGVVDVS